MGMRNWFKKLKSWQIGAIIGGAVGVIGTAITLVTGDISAISLFLVRFFARFGLGYISSLFMYPHCELYISVVVYGIFGAIIGYVYDRTRERWKK